MLTRDEALARLKKEREYEDHLVDVLSNYLLDCLDDIPGLSEEQISKTRKGLEEIRIDSIRHSLTFGELTQMVLQDGKDKY